MLRLVTTLLALEVERTRAPERAGEAAVGSFVNAVLDGEIDDRRDLIARGKELGVDLENGGSVLVVRIHPAVPGRGRLAGTRAHDRRARRRAASRPGALARCAASTIAVIVPGADEALSAPRRPGRAARGRRRRCRASRSVVGRSRMAVDPMDLHRAAGEALLAANVAVPDAERRSRACCRSRTPAPTACCCRR